MLVMLRNNKANEFNRKATTILASHSPSPIAPTADR